MKLLSYINIIVGCCRL